MLSEKHRSELIALISENSLDAVVTVPGANQEHLFGSHFHMSERPTVIMAFRDGTFGAVIPLLEKEAFTALGLDADVHYWQDGEGYSHAFEKLLRGRVFKRIGAEGQRIRLIELAAIQSVCPGVEILDMHKAISGLRLRKEKQEAQLIRKALEISEGALEAVLQKIRVGIAETAIRAMLLEEMFKRGAEGIAFNPIVAAGDNSANPHAAARDSYKIKTGDVLLLDFGAVWQSYNADITRTFFVGEVSDHDRKFYEAVKAANSVGRKAAKAGTTCHEVDDQVQKCLEASEFSRWMLHKTGHGLGREVHESPYIMRGNYEVIPSGAVFTVEPGLYIPGQLGVRIEDVVMVDGNGHECLSSFSRDLRVVG